MPYDFFQNRDCEYFPCHPGADPDTFSCIFCYCPLYALGENCGAIILIRKTGSRIVPNACGPTSGSAMGILPRRSAM